MKIQSPRLTLEAGSISEMEDLIKFLHEHRDDFFNSELPDPVAEDASEEETKLSNFYFEKIKRGFRRTKQQVHEGMTRLEALKIWYNQWITENPDENTPGQIIKVG